MPVWGIVFSVGFVLALAYYVLRQSKDSGVNVFPHNQLKAEYEAKK
ncbi:MAG: hypothetical protein AB1420_06120 [Bacillota bacterium]